MTVFIPTVKDLNPFLDEIINFSKHNFIFGNFKSYNKKHEIVLINWPEQLFNWKEPSDADLLFLEDSFKEWQKYSCILYVVHNLERHLGMNEKYKALYNLVLKYAKVYIHLGKNSLQLFKEKYPKKINTYIPHPLYLNSFKIFDKRYARQILGISKDAIVVISPGTVRTLEERELLIKSFNGIKRKNKLLLVPNMFYKKVEFDYKGRYFFKNLFDFKKLLEYFYNDLYKKRYNFGFGFANKEKLSLMMSAADVVFIPRINGLNSGNIFLGLTFKKILVGPNIGNINEFMDLFGFPKFNKDEKSSSIKAIRKAVEIYESNSYVYEEKLLNNFHGKTLAKQWDKLIFEIHSKL